jgi:hypothetical protein
MSAPETTAAARLEERDGKLVVTAPKGQLTPDILTRLREHKAELEAYLSLFGGQGTLRIGAHSDYLDEAGVSWAVWEKRAFNRLFREQREAGSLGQAMDVTVGANAPATAPLSYVLEPDKPDKLEISTGGPNTYACRVPGAYPTTPDISNRKPDKREAGPSAPEADLTSATFAGGIGVELYREGKAKTRWLMWVTRCGKRARRTDFATPYLDHGRRTAEAWYGEPLRGWHAPEGGRD